MAVFLKSLEKFGITNFRDLILTTFCLILVTFCSAFTQTFINLDCYNFAFFRGELLSFDIVMPTIGNIVVLFIFPSLAHIISLRKLILFSFIGIAIGLLGINFFIESLSNFVLRFFLGSFYGIVYVSLACLQAKIFPVAHRAICFSMVWVIISVFTAVGIALNDLFSTLDYVIGIGIVTALLGCLSSISLQSSKKGSIPREDRSLSSVQNNLPKGERSSFSKVFFKIPYTFVFLFVAGLVYTAILEDLPFFGEGPGLSRGHAALLLSLANIGTLIIAPLAGYYGDKVGIQKVLLFLNNFKPFCFRIRVSFHEWFYHRGVILYNKWGDWIPFWTLSFMDCSGCARR